MTRTTNARIAGFTFLFYIAIGLTSLAVSARASSGDEIPARLASMAQHASDVRITVLLALIAGICALVLGVTLYRITRGVDRDLALLGLIFRAGEGLLAAVAILITLALLWLGTNTGADAPDAATAHALGALLFRLEEWNTVIAATFFAAGSTLFSWLLLRGRMVPVPLAWLGVIASVLLVVLLPGRLVGFFSGPVVGTYMWLPMLVFEVVLALWLMIRGVPEVGHAVNTAGRGGERHELAETP